MILRLSVSLLMLLSRSASATAPSGGRTGANGARLSARPASTADRHVDRSSSPPVPSPALGSFHRGEGVFAGISSSTRQAVLVRGGGTVDDVDVEGNEREACGEDEVGGPGEGEGAGAGAADAASEMEEELRVSTAGDVEDESEDEDERRVDEEDEEVGARMSSGGYDNEEEDEVEEEASVSTSGPSHVIDLGSESESESSSTARLADDECINATGPLLAGNDGEINHHGDEDEDVDENVSEERGADGHPPPAREEDSSDDGGGDNDGEFSTSPAAVASVSHRRESARSLRGEGKVLHDAGDLDRAARHFRAAGNILDGILEQRRIRRERERELKLAGEDVSEEEGEGEDGRGVAAAMEDLDGGAEELTELAEEAATCHLHEALCRLKNDEPGECLRACTAVINDALSTSPSPPSSSEDIDDDDYEEERTPPLSGGPAFLGGGSGSASGLGGSSGLYRGVALSGAVRSRAYHRRAKGRLALLDREGALADARSAAFLGDRGAVELYGRLMREQNGSGDAGDGDEEGTAQAIVDLFRANGSGGGADGGGGFPFLGPAAASLAGAAEAGGGSGASPQSASPIASLFGGEAGGGGGGGGGGLEGALAAALAGGLGGNFNDAGAGSAKGGSGSGNGMDGLAKSVLTSLGKKLDDEETQRTVCRFVNSYGASKESVVQAASMAGVPLSEANADRIVQFCSGLTPQGLSRGVSLTKRALWMFNVTRKTFKVVSKYRHLLVYFFLLAWIRSAIMRPLVMPKKIK